MIRYLIIKGFLSTIFHLYYSKATRSDIVPVDIDPNVTFILSDHPVACPCPRIFDPVCATNGNSYSNACILDCIRRDFKRLNRPQVYLYHKGQCQIETCQCPDKIQEVCGTDGNDYKNECWLACKNNILQRLNFKLVDIAYRGACVQPLCVCPTLPIPVCGTDDKTYRNLCFLQCNSRYNENQGFKPIMMQSLGSCPYEICACSVDFEPICVTFNWSYNNSCILKCENRQRNALGQYSLKVKYPGLCIDCHCEPIENPICGSDGKTYLNACKLRCENTYRIRQRLPPIFLIYNGECKCNCGANNNPMCGTDGITYKNLCFLECASDRSEYRNQGPVRKAHAGVCQCNCNHCGYTYEPKCGSDLHVYWNICWLWCYDGCNTKRGLPAISHTNMKNCL